MKKVWQKFVVSLLVLTLFIPIFSIVNVQSDIQAASVKLNATSKTLVLGTSYKLKLGKNIRNVKWKSSNKRVATVSTTGLVIAKHKGTSTITAKYGTKTYKCEVTVVTQQKAYINTTFMQINKERRKYGYASFDKNQYLQDAAQIRAKELATKFSHNRPNGTKWTSAINMKYDFSFAGESIACDFTTPAAVVNAWMKSADSKANIINKRYTECGIGVYLGEDGYLYWVAIFAKRK